MCGSEATQGPHQVAQKSSTITLPFKSASATVDPSTPVSLKSGAGFPSSAVAASPALSSASSLATVASFGGDHANNSGAGAAPVLAEASSNVMSAFLTPSTPRLVI